MNFQGNERQRKTKKEQNKSTDSYQKMRKKRNENFDTFKLIGLRH